MKKNILAGVATLLCALPLLSVPQGDAAAKPTADLIILFKERATALFSESVGLRRELHQIPEPCFQEKKTAAFLAAYLKKLDLEVTGAIAGSGIKAVLRGSRPGPVIGLRADMDALPITESGGLPFASRQPGQMHACGHDVHMTNLLVCARLLSEVRGRLAGTVVFIFQPCEEGAAKNEAGGAERLIAAGILENPRLDALLALHVLPGLAAGRVSLRPGPIMANVASVYIHIQGKASHGAFPHQGIDAIVVAAAAIGQFQTLISRSKDPGEKAVLSIGKINGGVRSNIIAETVDMEGTVRTFSMETENAIRDGMKRILKGLEVAFGVTTRLDFEKASPAVVNDARLYDRLLPVFEGILGRENVLLAEPLTVGEDFAAYGRLVPSLLFFLGSGNGSALHTPTFTVDEDVLKIAPALLAGLAYSYLQSDTRP